MKSLVAPLLRFICTLFGIFVLTFLVLASIPGNPVFSRIEKGIQKDELEKRLEAGRLGSLDKFVVYSNKLLHFDFGKSLITDEDINKELWVRVKNTILLAFLAVLLFTFVGISFGILGALYSGSLLDVFLRLVTTAFVATPVFWFALAMVVIFSVQLGLFPAIYNGSFASMILPVLTVGLRPAAFLQRMVQERFEGILREQYIVAAYARGVSKSKIIFLHCLRNAIIPIVAVLNVEFGYLLTGAVVAETIFAYKGLGSYIVFGIQSRDHHVVLATVLTSCVMVAIVNMMSEIIIKKLDPRVEVAT
jgi:ABC-type dipeptide/oligopeptide/nickel transport system permease component